MKSPVARPNAATLELFCEEIEFVYTMLKGPYSPSISIFIMPELKIAMSINSCSCVVILSAESRVVIS
jgi:hypothetical protein